MRTKLLVRTAASLFLLMPSVVCSANLDWRAAENVPFTIIRGVEVAHHAAGKPAAKLSFVCSAQGGLHLLLRTRLPIPQGYRRNMLGRDDDVSLFVGDGIERNLIIIVDVVAKGRDNVQNTDELLFGIDEPETIITPPLSVAQVATLEGWFGSDPPSKVAVVGILETGVFMVGARGGDAIRSLREGCTATPG